MAMAPHPMMAMMAAAMMSRAEPMDKESLMRRAAPMKKMAIRSMARDEDDECEEAFAPASMLLYQQSLFDAGSFDEM